MERDVQHYLCFICQVPRNCCLVMVSLAYYWYVSSGMLNDDCDRVPWFVMQELHHVQFEKDAPRFSNIFCLNNYTQLRVILSEYEKVAHRSIQQTFQREMSGDLLSGMLILGRLT